ncbi:MAG: GntR family transcriptional regulator, partial [Planctomycetota bacterium]|nr:GntR family transcriptional regulator [Planctomycetota bacterium]
MKPLQRKLLRHEVADHLRIRIRKEYQPGDRLPSEAKLCEELQVSLVTLREALSILAHEGLIVRKHGSGTYVAEHSDLPVGVLIDLDISQPGVSPFFIRLVQQIRSRLEEGGISTRLYV